MTSNTDCAQLTLSLNEYDADPKGDYLGLTMEARNAGFSGTVHFWASRSDIDHFLGAASDLDNVDAAERIRRFR